jgi:hypothetical protein
VVRARHRQAFVTSEDTAAPADKRKGHRRTIDHPCWIDGGTGQPPIKGHLDNVSHAGAKLTCEGSVELPDQFNLYMTHDGIVGRSCKVVWRAENEIGLHFVSRNVPRPHWLEADAVAVVVE